MPRHLRLRLAKPIESHGNSDDLNLYDGVESALSGFTTHYGSIPNQSSDAYKHSRYFFYRDPSDDEHIYLINPALKDQLANNVTYYSCLVTNYDTLHQNGKFFHDPEDTWHTSTALGFTFGIWQTAHLLYGSHENNLLLFDSTVAWNTDLLKHFQPISLVFPAVNALVGGLLHYFVETRLYEKEFGFAPSEKVEKAIRKQSASLAASMAMGTLGFEAGLQIAKAVLTLTQIIPQLFLAYAIVAISAGFGMALLTVATQKAIGEKNSGRHFLKLFIATFLQGTVWWMFRLVPYELPTQVGKALLNGLCTMLSVTLLNEFTKPIEYGFFSKKQDKHDESAYSKHDNSYNL